MKVPCGSLTGIIKAIVMRDGMRYCNQTDSYFFETRREDFKMEYSSTVTLKDGRACILRNGTASEGH